MLECLHSDLVQQKQSTCYERPPHSKSERKVGLRLFAFYFEFIVKVVLSKRDAHSQKKGMPREGALDELWDVASHAQNIYTRKPRAPKARKSPQICYMPRNGSDSILNLSRLVRNLWLACKPG